MSGATALMPAGRAGWAERIGKAWGGALEAVLATGRALIEAKVALPHGEFIEMVKSDLPFDRTTVRIR